MDTIKKYNCSLHQNKLAQYLYVEDGDANLLKCSHCIIEQDISPEKLILLQSILDGDYEKAIISNWPPQMSLEIQQSLKQIVSEKKKDSLLASINNFFNNFSDTINSKLSEARKHLIVHINELDQAEQQIMHTYQSVSEFSQFKKIFSNNEIEQEEILNQLMRFFSKMNSKSCVNEQYLQKSVQSFEEKSQIINFEKLKGIEIMIYQLLEKLHLGLNKNNPNHNANEQINNNNNNQKAVKKEKVYDKYYFDNTIYREIQEISYSILEEYTKFREKLAIQKKDYQNKFNNLKDELIKQEKDLPINTKNNEDTFLKKFKISFNSTKKQLLDSQYHQNKFYLDRDIAQLLTVMTANEKKSNCLYLYNKIQMDSAFCNQIDIQKLLVYPILDITNKQKFIPVKFSFIPYSKIDKIPEWLQIQIDEDENQYNFTLNTKNQNFKLKSNITFENEKRYIIRFQFNMPLYLMDQIQIGLVSEIQQNLNQNFPYFLSNNCASSNLEVKKGLFLYGVNPYLFEEINEIEMRVSISENILIFTDFPYSENVIQLNTLQDKLDKTKLWSLAISSQGPNNKVIKITEIFEVDEFPILIN